MDFAASEILIKSKDMRSHGNSCINVLPTLGKGLEGMGLGSDGWDEGRVTVVHVVLELQLRPLDILGMDELEAANRLTHSILGFKSNLISISSLTFIPSPLPHSYPLLVPAGHLCRPLLYHSREYRLFVLLHSRSFVQ